MSSENLCEKSDTVHKIVRTHLEYINIQEMMKNRHLSRAIAESEFWYFE